MKIYIEIPRSFIVDSYRSHAFVREAYRHIFSAAVDSSLEVVLIEPNSYGLSERSADGIYYLYHKADPGPNAYCIKASALPGRWYFDKCGYSGWSSLALSTEIQEQSAQFDLGRADKAIALFRTKFKEENISQVEQPNGPLEQEIADLGDFVFYPLQVNSDEVLKLGRFAQFEVVSRLAELTRKHERHVVFKRHPLCDSPALDRILADFAGHPFLHISNSSVHQLIPACRAVLVSNSGVGVEALIHGKPVFSLARSEYAHMTHRLSTLDDLESVLLYQPAEQTEKVRRQLGYLLNVFWVDVSREDQIALRIREHVKSFRAAAPASGVADVSLAQELSILSRTRKELGDVVDLLLASYPTLSIGQREKVAPLLARAASHGLNPERIFRNTDTMVWRKSMHRFRKNGDLETAESLARKIIGEQSDDSDAQLMLSRILDARGMREESLAAAKAAVECPEPTASALSYFGRRMLAISKTNSAVAASYADRALALNPAIAEAHFVKARTLIVEGDIARALVSSAEAVRLAPNNQQCADLHRKILRKAKQPA